MARQVYPEDKHFYGLSAFLLIILAVLVCGALDTVDDLREQSTYCQMVHDKAWPDYRHTYATECVEPKHGKG